MKDFELQENNRRDIVFESREITLLKSRQNDSFLLKQCKQNPYKFMNEYRILQSLQNIKGFPKIGKLNRHYGEMDPKNQICNKQAPIDQNIGTESICSVSKKVKGLSFEIQKLDYTLEELIEKKKLPLSCTKIIGKQLLQRIQALHKHGILHKDLKPDNIMIKRQGSIAVVYLIDFNLSEPFDSKLADEGTSKENIKGEAKTSFSKVFKGNQTYSSLSQMEGSESSLFDDLESFVYIVVKLLNGKLPWSGNYSWSQVWQMKRNLSTGNFFQADSTLNNAQCALKMLRQIRQARNATKQTPCIYKLLRRLFQ